MTGAPWAVVLAGGDGQRVSALTRDASGQAVPKQFCAFGGRAPMVRWALARARRVAPAPRVLVVVNEHHRRFWERDLADIPRRNLLIQPCNRGTAAGALIAVLEVQARGSAAAPVILLPSDHYVANEAALRGALLTAVHVVRQNGRSAVLLGIRPTEVEPEYGWIEPAAGGVVAPVRQFVEKPSAEIVRQMMKRGALINSFILVARAQAVLDLFERTLPGLIRAFRRYVGDRWTPGGARRLYEGLSAIDLSRDVLVSAAACLSVVRVPPCGWSDLGTPDRLRRFLSESPSLPPAPAPVSVCPAAAA